MKEWKGYKHGINLGGWLSQCNHTKERYDNFIKEEDFKTVSEWGLDHVRIPVDYNLVEEADGTYKEDGFAYLDNAVSWCEKYGLNMILDLHKTYGYSFDAGEKEAGFFDNEDYQERFYKLWEKFAGKYGNIGERVAFELLNEVTDKEYSDKWNEISYKCIERIRAIAPNVKILVGGYYNNSVEAVKDLRDPYDENIIYNFHCYEPLIFTHQGAYWVPGMHTDFRISIDATYAELEKASKDEIDQAALSFKGLDPEAKMSAEYFELQFAEAVKVAEERNVALYCGEYGVINLADAEDTVRWYKYISEVFDRHGIGRAAWSLREMDFGFVDEHMKDVLQEVIKYL